jgi:phage FluMu gp28-like protein
MTVREEADYRSAEDYRLAARFRSNTTSRFYIGVDLGQKQDHTAIVVVEKAVAERTEFLLVRHVERVALGTPYPLVVAHLREMVSRTELRRRCALTVDGTGLGGPVVEMLRAAGLGCEITAVTITGGEREGRSRGLSVSVPKRDLMAGVQVALDNGELRIARRLKELGSLVRELVDVRMTSGLGSGRVRIGADGYGEHDDLVIALALACWRAQRRGNGERGQRLF